MDNTTRPDWHEWAIRGAKWASERATCPRAAVGAIILNDDHHIVGVGYNGSPPDEPHCLDIGCEMEHGHCMRAVHAEINAIVHATQPLKGSTLYIYSSRGETQPCRKCFQAIRSAGLKVFGEERHV